GGCAAPFRPPGLPSGLHAGHPPVEVFEVPAAPDAAVGDLVELVDGDLVVRAVRGYAEELAAERAGEGASYGHEAGGGDEAGERFVEGHDVRLQAGQAGHDVPCAVRRVMSWAAVTGRPGAA